MSNIVTNSIKTLKNGLHKKKKKSLFLLGKRISRKAK